MKKTVFYQLDFATAREYRRHRWSSATTGI